jgi:hypothetical protein
MAKAERKTNRRGDGRGDKRKGSTGAPEHWKEDPDEHDYPAARDYLSLLLNDVEVGPVVEALKEATITHRKAKDLLRASRLALLGPENPEVMKDLRKVRRGERLSPVLLVRGALGADVAMTVADGYHRICASYHISEDVDIPCRIVDRPKARASGMSTAAGVRGTRTRGERATADRHPPQVTGRTDGEG